MNPTLPTMLLLPTICVMMALHAAPGRAQEQARGPVAWYRFDDAQAPGRDASGHGHEAVVADAEVVAGRDGNGLRLDGSGGLEVAATERLRAAGGFALECRVRFDAVDQNMNLISKDGEYVLRVDPPGEGGNISFFVNAGGRLEPRVRGRAPRTGEWHHILATWDGLHATLWMDGEQFRRVRTGAVAPTETPVLIGGPYQWAPVGLRGTLDEVKLYDRAIEDGEVMLEHYGLTAERVGEPVGHARFDFETDAEGWEGVEVEGLAAAEGRLRGRVGGHASAFVHRGLQAPVEDAAFISLRMAVSEGKTGRLVYVTTAGPGAVSFPLIADGEMRSYVLPVGTEARWRGTLTSLALAPSDTEAEVEVEFVRISAEAEAPPEFSIHHFLPDRAINRAGRRCNVGARLRNHGGAGEGVTATLTAPEGVGVFFQRTLDLPAIPHGDALDVSWDVEAPRAGRAPLTLTVEGGGMSATTAQITVDFTPPVDLPAADYVPEPEPALGDLLVGVHYCPLWKQGSRSAGWEVIVPFPERKPALGWYDEDDPEVTDWEIKWALEHGINFFIYCWYRHGQGDGVQMALEHAIHDGLFNSRYGDLMQFTIMWENQSRGQAGVASEEDFLETLLPFWIETYFKHPTYLKIDNKPVLFIYRPEYLVGDLGSVENVRSALEKAQEVCRAAGFDGLITLGEYRGTQPGPLQSIKDLGLDYAFQYCWPIPNDPDPPTAIRAQQDYLQAWKDMDVIPFLATVAMGWDSTPWHPTHSAWRLPPDDFRALCEWTKEFMQTLPEDSLGRRMVLLDNWNEFGEGHYIMPHREYGFGYLDAVRAAFTDAPEPHVDLVPEDVGLGPYDSRFRAFADLLEQCDTHVVAEEGVEPGLLGWWTFEEEDDSPVAFDWSGNRQGGMYHEARRTEGLRGRALVCDGGSVNVPAQVLRLPTAQITVETWIRSDVEGQTDRWFVNCIFGDGASGFRLGLSGGRLTWAIPQAPWSHHLHADRPLPTGRWVHVAATYDGEMMRLYMEGVQVGALERRGIINPPSQVLALGNFARNHRAHFQGLLEEVRLHGRALTAEEIAARAGG